MTLEVEINGTAGADGRYLTFAPSPARVRQLPAGADVDVTLSSTTTTPDGGEIVFYSAPDAASEETLQLQLPASGDWVNFHVGGRWGSPSSADQDCELLASTAVDRLAVPLMVRVRKNANALQPSERDRFLNAFGILNNGGAGIFGDFRDMHVDPADGEEHRGPQFLPWHRAFLLDLERQLQAIDPAVALHYWRFDEPAPNVLSADFMGETTQRSEGAAGSPVQFTPGHALSGWVTNSTPGISRSAYFDTQTQSAPGLSVIANFPLIDQQTTLALGDTYNAFRSMEGSPHGAAHVSFGGWISSINTAAKDPLFFMLHSNIDRLWALWQWLEDRMDENHVSSYAPQNRDGRRVADTLWPWNDVTAPPRPGFAPRGNLGFTPSSCCPAPGPSPTVGDMIDSQGQLSVDRRLGFGYDDVPYENPGVIQP